MLVYQRVKQFHKPVLYHCTMIIPLCVYIYIYTPLMWLKQCHVYHPPVITIFIGAM